MITQQMVFQIGKNIPILFGNFNQIKMFKIISAIVTNKSLLAPKYRLKNVAQIATVPQLMGSNQQIYIFDKDDTLVPLHEFQVVNQSSIQMLVKLEDSGKNVYVVSNSVRNAGKSVSYTHNNEKKQIQILHPSTKKPKNSLEIKKLIEQDIYTRHNGNETKVLPENTVIVGDRLLTDVLMGNMEGWITVLVEPIEISSVQKHGFGVWLMRKVQYAILKLI